MSDDGYARLGVGIVCATFGFVGWIALEIGWNWLTVTLGLLATILGFLVELGIQDKGEEDEC